MPAFVKSRLGEVGISEADGTIECALASKKSKKLFLISEEFILLLQAFDYGVCHFFC